MRLVFLGAPGAGKGTQAVKLVRKIAVPHISTGEMLRELRGGDSPLSREIAGYLDSGQLVPDDKMNEAVRARLAKGDTAGGFVLDGYPRTVAQAQALAQTLSENGQTLDAVVFFNLHRHVAVERLSGRRTCESCGANYHVKFNPPKNNTCEQCGGELFQREDDRPEIIKRRFEVFQEKTADLVDYYTNKGKLIEVDATAGPQEVYSRMLKALGLSA